MIPLARRRESGAALLVAMLMLALMGLIGFASLDTVMRDRQVAGNTSLAQNAMYAADAGVAASLEVLRTEVVPPGLYVGYTLAGPVPTGTLPNNTSYAPDSTASSPDDQIQLVAWGAQCWAGFDLNQPYRDSVWSIRTQGQAPGGAVARVHVTANRCLDAN